MAVEVRPIRAEEWDAVYDAATRTFGWPASDEDRERTRTWNELDRMHAAFDDGRVVATSGALSLPIVVPGSTVLPAAAVTLVTTSPTHRRTGLMRSAMRALLDQALERGDSLATLWASQSNIYGRVGFGSAIDAADAEILVHHAALRDDVPTGSGSVTLHDDDSVRPEVEAVYRAVAVDTPGMMIRRERDWDMMFLDPAASRDGKPRARWAAYTESGEPRGYVRYRNTEKWEDHNFAGEVQISEMNAVDATALAELWRFVASLDLVSKINVHLVPLRSRLSALLADPRRLRLAVTESIWVRLLDLPSALEARHYSTSGELTLEVDDPMGYGSGVFSLRGDGTGAKVDPVGGGPDVRLGIDSLSAAYLGAPRIGDLAWAGRIEGDPEAVELLDAMFRWPVEPTCTVHF